MKIDVAIAGAGPTGLALAAELSRRGIQPLVLDRLQAGANTSRAAVIHARTLEVLEPLGVNSRLLDSGVIVPVFKVRDREKTLATIRFDGIPSKYPFTLMCPQDHTENILLSRLEALGGSVTRPCEFLAAHDAGHGVELQYRCGESIGMATASWLVGCDGSHSQVREQASIPFEGSGYDETFILADVEMDWPLERTEVSLFLSDQGLVVIAPLPANHFRIVATVRHNVPAEPSIEEFQQILDERGPQSGRPRIRRLVWASRFHVSHRVAGCLRKGHILLAGDAAHVHSPAGGQGMNTGIQDAMALAAALESVLRTGNESALEQWESDRLRVATSVVRFTDGLTNMATVSSPFLKTLRNVALEFAGHIPYVQHALAEKLAEINNR